MIIRNVDLKYKDDGFFKILKSAFDKGLIKNMIKPIRSHLVNTEVDLDCGP